jgi:hypothetical protein
MSNRDATPSWNQSSPLPKISAGTEISELSSILSGRNCEPRGQHESGIHYTGNQGRDFKTESGSASARTRSEENNAGTAQNISGRQERNCRRTTGTVGENQGSKEIEKSPDLVCAHSNILEVAGIRGFYRGAVRKDGQWAVYSDLFNGQS